jgi:hypothetical protein
MASQSVSFYRARVTHQPRYQVLRSQECHNLDNRGHNGIPGQWRQQKRNSITSLSRRRGKRQQPRRRQQQLR